MQNKYLSEFITMFDALHNAGSVLLEQYEEKEDLIFSFSVYDKNKVEEYHRKISSFDISLVLDEIRNNLYFHTDKIEIYIASILRRFIDIDIFFNKKGHYGEYVNACHRYLNEHAFHTTIEDERDKIGDYVLYCSDLYDQFMINLDALCLDFDVDIMTIQENAGLYIYQRGTASTCSLYTNGYKKQLDEIWKDDPKGAIPLKMSKHDADTTDGIYQYDIDMILKIYKFCQGDIFDISFGRFITAVENADFSLIISTDGLIKNKFYYSISIIKEFVHSSEWYKKAANSINIEPTVCTKGKVDGGWKKAIDTIK